MGHPPAEFSHPREGPVLSLTQLAARFNPWRFLFRPGAAGPVVPLMDAPLAPPSAPLSSEMSGVLRRSLRISCTEGMLAEVFTACASGTVVTAWALHLRLGPFLVGILGALPFLGQLVQFPAAWLTSTLGHRRMALWAVTLSRQVMLPLCVLPFLGAPLAWQQRALVTVVALSAALGVLGNNAWVAWMGELVPQQVRGRYFGRRTALCTAGSLAAQLLAGVALDVARRHGVEAAGLAGLALFACVAGAMTTVLLAAQHDPAPLSHAQPFRFDARAALRPFRDADARRVLTYQVAWNVAVGISAPFFGLHSLQFLKMSFSLMALQAAAVAGVRILSAPAWGRAIDRVGAQPVVVACSVGMGLTPLVWLLPAEGRLWPLYLDIVLTGLVWGGNTLASFALPLSVAPREGRPFYLAAFATAGGVAYAAGSALGGGIAAWVPARFTLGGVTWVNLHAVFVISSAARLLSALLALRIREPAASRLSQLGVLVRQGTHARMRESALRVARPFHHARRMLTGRRPPDSPARHDA